MGWLVDGCVGVGVGERSERASVCVWGGGALARAAHSIQSCCRRSSFPRCCQRPERTSTWTCRRDSARGWRRLPCVVCGEHGARCDTVRGAIGATGARRWGNVRTRRLPSPQCPRTRETPSASIRWRCPSRGRCCRRSPTTTRLPPARIGACWWTALRAWGRGCSETAHPACAPPRIIVGGIALGCDVTLPRRDDDFDRPPTKGAGVGVADLRPPTSRSSIAALANTAEVVVLEACVGPVKLDMVRPAGCIGRAQRRNKRGGEEQSRHTCVHHVRRVLRLIGEARSSE